MSVNLLRVIRVIRFNGLLVSCSPELKLSLEALRRSKMASFNLGQFLFLVIFIYSLIGVAAFKHIEDIVPINDKISFNSVIRAIILMIQISTSAAWDALYIALINNHYNAFVVFLFIWSFLFICILTIMNLVLTVIMNYYAKACEIEKEKKALSTHDCNDFDDKWLTLAAPENPLFIAKSQLPTLMNRLDKSSALNSITPTDENIQLLGIPVRNDQQLYRGDVLIALNQIRLRQPRVTHKK